MQKTLVPIDRADKGGEASTIRKADDAATEKERAENIEGNRFAFPRVFRQKYHSSIGRFLHALLRNAKNTLSSQREIPLETLRANATGREYTHNNNRKNQTTWDIFHWT